MSITDHLFIPQSRISNMCVCGEAMSAHGDPTPAVTSFYMETSQGGIPITLCSCGVLIYQPMAATHMRKCDSFRRDARLRLHQRSAGAGGGEGVILSNMSRPRCDGCSNYECFEFGQSLPPTTIVDYIHECDTCGRRTWVTGRSDGAMDGQQPPSRRRRRQVRRNTY